jgi:hypothetical protein
MGVKKIYIAGKITGVPDFRLRFKRIERTLELKGNIVLSPANLPEGLKYEEYMDIDFAMIKVSDAVYMMPCWVDSPGATRERDYAISLGKEIIYADG